MPNLDLTETSLSVPRYIKDYVKELSVAKGQSEGRYVSQKEYLVKLISSERKKAKL